METIPRILIDVIIYLLWQKDLSQLTSMKGRILTFLLN